MQIQVNSDNHIESSIRLEEWVRNTIESTLERYEEDLTRVEVYLRDENGDKPGPHDLSCRLEARPKGDRPCSDQAGPCVGTSVRQTARQATRCCEKCAGQ